MTVTPPFVCTPGVVKAEMCDRIIALGNALPSGAPQVVRSDSESYRGDKRKGVISLFPKGEEFGFLYDGINYFAEQANRENWNFELLGLLPLQYSIYRRGDFFDWHRDTMTVPKELSPPGKPLVRKLSFSLQLSNDHDYVGGDFQVRNADRSVDEALWTQMRQRGSFIIFPSLTVHQVTPVIFGERRSLVGWVLGTASDEDLRNDIASRYEVPEK